jgi:hypothetical protein
MRKLMSQLPVGYVCFKKHAGHAGLLMKADNSQKPTSVYLKVYV